MFIYSQYQVDNEDEADDELILVGLEVRDLNEDEESLTVQTSQWSHFPLPNSTLSDGVSYVVLAPDSALSSLYGDGRVTVYHDKTDIADCLLGGNYLPPEIFGRDADIDLRKRVFDALDIEDAGVSDDGIEYRNQIREIAGIDESEDAEQASFENEAERLKSEYKYTELKSMASDAGIDNANQKKDDLAEYLVSTDEDY